MEKIKLLIQKTKVDAKYSKKRHFNAADRKEKYHNGIGIPLVIINILTGSILFYIISEDSDGWIKYIPLILAIIASLLSGFQTYFNFGKQILGHRRVGNNYLAIMKRCDNLIGFVESNLIKENELIKKVEALTTSIEEVNKEAEAFSTSDRDYQKAKTGIESGEEKYTTKELNI